MAGIKELYDKLKKKYKTDCSVEVYSTGYSKLDSILNGGFPRGMIVEIFGDPGAGKSTATLDILCNMIQQYDVKVLYIDTEFAVNDSLLSGIGLTPYMENNFFYFRLRTYKELDSLLIEFFKGKDTPDIVVLDSMKAVVPNIELTTTIDEAQAIGIRARYESAFFNKYKGIFANKGVLFLVINQIRVKNKPGGYGFKMEIDSAASNALLHSADIRIRIKKRKAIQDEDGTTIGAGVSFEVQKNKITLSRSTDLVLIYGQGISLVYDIFDRLLDMGLMEQGGGGHYTLHLGDEAVKLRGRPAVIEYIKENIEPLHELIQLANQQNSLFDTDSVLEAPVDEE